MCVCVLGEGGGGMRHDSLLVYMVGIVNVYIDKIFAFYEYIFYTHLYCLVGCF